MAKKLKNKRFCDLSSDIIKRQLDLYIELVSNPRYICQKCYRLSHHKENLCQAHSIKKLPDRR